MTRLDSDEDRWPSMLRRRLGRGQLAIHAAKALGDPSRQWYEALEPRSGRYWPKKIYDQEFGKGGNCRCEKT